MMKKLSGRPYEPMMFAIMDLKAPGRKGDLRKALNFMKYCGVKLGMDDPGLMETLGMDA